MDDLNQWLVTKGNGDLVPFSEEKLRRSLLKSGAPVDRANSIIKKIKESFQLGLTTKEIYNQAYTLLYKQEQSNAARYRLKQAIMELGPDGYIFEHFIGEMFRELGYQVDTGIVMNGACVNHEVDVRAENEHEILLVECKYHNTLQNSSDVKVPLYVNSRVHDIAQNLRNTGINKGKKIKGWIFTNTQFSEDAMNYGQCIGLTLISWAYPKFNGLKERIDELKLYPITCLTSLSIEEKQLLMSQDIILCKDLYKHLPDLKILHLSPSRNNNIQQEIKLLCHTQ